MDEKSGKKAMEEEEIASAMLTVYHKLSDSNKIGYMEAIGTLTLQLSARTKYEGLSRELYDSYLEMEKLELGKIKAEIKQINKRRKIKESMNSVKKINNRKRY